MDNELLIKSTVEDLLEDYERSDQANNLRNIVIKLKSGKWINKEDLSKSIIDYMKYVEKHMLLSYNIVAHEEAQRSIKIVLADTLRKQIIDDCNKIIENNEGD